MYSELLKQWYSEANKKALRSWTPGQTSEWLRSSYSKIITDKKQNTTQKVVKKRFIRLSCKDRRFKVEKYEDGDLYLFKILTLYVRGNKLSIKERRRIFRSSRDDYLTRNWCCNCAYNSNYISIDKMFDWREILKKNARMR